MLCTLLLALAPQSFHAPQAFSTRTPVAGPRVVLHCDRGPERVEAWTRFLDRYFDDVHVQGVGSSLDHGLPAVRILDLAPGADLGAPGWWRPYEHPAVFRSAVPTLAYGATGAAQAGALGLLGAEHLGAPPLASTATWTGAEPRPLDPALAPGDELPPLPSEALGGLRPPLADSLALAPEVGVSVVGEDERGRKVALVWHQEELAHVVVDLHPDELPEDWQGLLARAIEIAAGFGSYGGRGPLTPGVDLPVLDEDHSALRELVGAPDFLATRVEALTAELPTTRASARAELERHTGADVWNQDPHLPEPGASAEAWRAYLAEHGEHLAFDAMNLTWRTDFGAMGLGRRSSDLAPVERADELLPWMPRGEPVTTAAELRGALRAYATDARDRAAAIPPASLLAGYTFGPDEQARMEAVVERGRAEAEERWRRAGFLAVLRAVEPGRLEPAELLALASAGENDEGDLLPLYAAVLARLGPAGVGPLLDLAGHDRVLDDRNLERLGAGDPYWAPSGRLVPAFRALARHSEADASLFAELVAALDLAIGRAADAEDPVTWISSLCLADECLAGLAVGVERGLPAEAELDALAAVAKHRWSVLPERLRSALADLLAGPRPEASSTLALDAWESALEGFDEEAGRWSYSGPFPVASGPEGLRRALGELTDLPVPTRQGGVRAIGQRLSDEGLAAFEQLFDAGEPVLAVRLAAMVENGDLIAPLFDLGEQRLEDEAARRWWRRELAFSLGSPYVDRRPAEARLLSLLEDSDPWLRAFTTWSLREPQGALSTEVRAALTARSSAEDPAQAALSEDALLHGAQPAGWRIRDVLEVEEPDRVANVGHLGENPWSDLESEDPEQRFRAAWHLAVSQGIELLAGLERGEALAAERVARVEAELRAWIAHLCELMDDEFFGGPGTDGLIAMGAVPLVELEHELMRPARFPIGSATYTELSLCLHELGGGSWPVFLASVHHWRGHGFGDLRGGALSWRGKDDERPMLPAWGPHEARILAPFLAMRFARDAVQGPFGASNAERIDAEGRPSEAWLRLFRNLGEAGRAALDELGGHPDPAVRSAALRCRKAL